MIAFVQDRAFFGGSNLTDIVLVQFPFENVDQICPDLLGTHVHLVSLVGDKVVCCSRKKVFGPGNGGRHFQVQVGVTVEGRGDSETRIYNIQVLRLVVCSSSTVSSDSVQS